MNLGTRLIRLIRGAKAFENSKRLEDEIKAEKKAMAPNQQALQSGVRVVQNMTGALRMMTETK